MDFTSLYSVIITISTISELTLGKENCQTSYKICVANKLYIEKVCIGHTHSLTLICETERFSKKHIKIQYFF